ncbi:MAG: YlxR family protein [Chloroflexi bacterium]|nr:YlxR family protein [Chloroflexota bacterium]
MGTKHIPQRTCIACRAVRGKKELARVVRTPEQRVVADPTGKHAGRGAYLCRTRECWETALSARGRLENALHLEMPISQDDLARLREFAATLPPREPTNAVPQNETL